MTGLSLGNVNSTSSSIIRKLNRITQNDYADIVSKYKKVELALDTYFKYEEGFTSVVEQGTFSGTYSNNYQYKMTINDSIVFLYDSELEYDDEDDADEKSKESGNNKVETEIHGEVSYGNGAYKIEGEIETNIKKNKNEIEIKIIYSEGNYIEISREIDVEGLKYKYVTYENGNEISEIEIEKKYNKSSKKNVYDVEYNEGNQKYYYVVSSENNIVVNYRHGSIKGQFVVIYEDSNKKYYDKDNNLKI